MKKKTQESKRLNYDRRKTQELCHTKIKKDSLVADEVHSKIKWVDSVIFHDHNTKSLGLENFETAINLSREDNIFHYNGE